MRKDAAVQGGNQRNAHILAKGRLPARLQVHTFEHVDQADQRTNHTKRRSDRGTLIIHSRRRLMACRHALDVILKDGTDAVGVVCVDDQHDRLLEEGVLLLRRKPFQREQAVFTCRLCQFDQLVNIVRRVVLLHVEHDRKMLRDCRQHGNREAGDHNRKRAADNDHNAGAVAKVHDLLEFIRRETIRHAQHDDDDCQQQTDDICNVHTLYSCP